MRNLKFALAIAGALLAVSSSAIADGGIRRTPCGYQQITSLSAATLLTIPPACGANPTLAVITAEAQAVRYRDDGSAPTATVGMPVAIAVAVSYEGTVSKIQFIEQTGGAKLNVLFYR